MTQVFILAGQSNMAGAGVAGELPERLRGAPPGVRLYEHGTFRDLVHGDRFGPEVGIAHALAEPAHTTPVVLCKVATGGANLMYDWNPDGVSRGEEDTYRGPLYPALLAALAGLRTELDTEGESLDVAGMLWMQGERDSVFEHMAQAYETNLTRFIARVRADTQVADLPFIMAQICPRILELETGVYRHPYRRLVQQAKRTVAADVARVALVPTDDLPQSDHLHFNAAGQIELGRRYAQAWRALSHEGAPENSG